MTACYLGALSAPVNAAQWGEGPTNDYIKSYLVRRFIMQFSKQVKPISYLKANAAYSGERDRSFRGS